MHFILIFLRTIFDLFLFLEFRNIFFLDFFISKVWIQALNFKKTVPPRYTEWILLIA